MYLITGHAAYYPHPGTHDWRCLTLDRSRADAEFRAASERYDDAYLIFIDPNNGDYTVLESS